MMEHSWPSALNFCFKEMSSHEHHSSVPIIPRIDHPLLNWMPCNENCDTDGNIDKVDRPPMLTEPTMLMKLTASPAGRTLSSVVGGDGGERGGGRIGDKGWLALVELPRTYNPPSVHVLPLYVSLLAYCITYIYARAHVSLHRGGWGGRIIREYVYVAPGVGRGWL